MYASYIPFRFVPFGLGLRVTVFGIRVVPLRLVLFLDDE